MTPKPTRKEGAPGRGQLYIDGKLAGRCDILQTIPFMIRLIEGFTYGADGNSPVWEKFDPPFKFTGTTHAGAVDMRGEVSRGPCSTGWPRYMTMTSSAMWRTTLRSCEMNR